MKKHISYIVSGLFMVAVIAGCSVQDSGDSGHDGRRHARNLYLELRNHTNRYIDTLRHLPDSADLSSFETRYERGLNDIYYRYAPDTEHEMTSGEQDTLWMLTERYIRLKKRMGAHYSFPLDSVTAPKPHRSAWKPICCISNRRFIFKFLPMSL